MLLIMLFFSTLQCPRKNEQKMQRLLSLGGCSVCKGSSARGAGSAKGWAVNLLLVVVWLFLQCRESCQGGALVWRELGGAEE